MQNVRKYFYAVSSIKLDDYMLNFFLTKFPLKFSEHCLSTNIIYTSVIVMPPNQKFMYYNQICATNRIFFIYTLMYCFVNIKKYYQ